MKLSVYSDTVHMIMNTMRTIIHECNYYAGLDVDIRLELISDITTLLQGKPCTFPSGLSGTITNVYREFSTLVYVVQFFTDNGNRMNSSTYGREITI